MDRRTPSRPSGSSSLNLKLERSPPGSVGTTDHSASSPSNNFNAYARSLNQFSMLDYSLAEFSSAEQIQRKILRQTRSYTPPQERMIQQFYKQRKIEANDLKRDLKAQIENIINQSLEQILVFDHLKDHILKFDKLRADYHNKLKGNQNTQALTKENINILNAIFSYIRFILTRFGKIINYYDFFEQYYNRRQLSKHLSTSKVEPQLHKYLHSDTRYSNQSDSSELFSKNIISKLLGQGRRFQSLSSFEDKLKIDKIKDVLMELTEKEKLHQIKLFMKALGSRWINEYEQIILNKPFREDRRLRVPLVQCRLCSQNFYADREAQHSNFCEQKISKIKDQLKVNKLFLDLQSQATQCIIDADKKNQQIINTPNLGISQSKKHQLLQTPTLKNRIPMLRQMASSLVDDKNYLSTPKPTTLQTQGSLQESLTPQIMFSGGQFNDRTRTSTFKKSSNQPILATYQTFERSEPEDGKKIEEQNFMEEIKSDLAKIPPLKSQVSQSTIQNNPQSQLMKYLGQKQDQPLTQMNPIGSRNDNNSQQTKPKDTNQIVNTLRTLEGMKKSSQEEKKEVTQQEKVVQQAKMLKQATFGDLKILENKNEEEKKISSNYFSSLLGVNGNSRNDQQEKKETQVIKPALLNVNSFMKSQQKEEKKNLDETVKVIDVTETQISAKEEKKMEVKKSSNFNKIQELNSLILPKSPYLEKMHCAFRDVAKFNNSRNETQILQQQQAQENMGQKKISQRDQQISSPYIGLTRGKLTKEQRMMIKNYIQNEIFKGVPQQNEKYKKGIIKKANPISNAFTLDFKNQREEVIKNIENLRKSVKLQKRANPLEKIMTKMAKQEEIQKDKDLQKSSKKLSSQNQLQSIQEEDINWPHLDLGKTIFEEKKIDKKILEIKKDSQKFKGNSPIITFRPLNNVTDKATSISNTPIGTPMHSKTNSITPRHQIFSDESSINTTEDKMKVFENAKRELDILEIIKKMAYDSFKLTNDNLIGFSQQRKVLESYLRQVRETLNFDVLSDQGLQVAHKLEEVLQQKVQALDELIHIERNYDKTLPIQAKKIKKEDEKMSHNKMKRHYTNSINSRDDGSKRGSFQKNRFTDGSSNSPLDQKQLTSQIERKQENDLLLQYVRDMKAQKPQDLSVSPQSIISSNISFSQQSFNSNQVTPLIQGRRNFPNSFNQYKLNLTPSGEIKAMQGTYLPQIPPYKSKIDTQRTNNSNQQLDQIEEEKRREESIRNIITITKKKSQFKIQEQKGRSRTVSRQNSLEESFSQSSYGDEVIEISPNMKNIKLDQNKPNNQGKQITTYMPKKQGKQKETQMRRMSMLDKVSIPQQNKAQPYGIPSKGSLFNKKSLEKSNEYMKLSHFRKNRNQSLSPTRLSLKLEKRAKKNTAQNGNMNFECQSDIVVGMNYDKEVIESDRDIYSDFHDFLFVEDLFLDQERFEQVLDRINEQDFGYDNGDILTMDDVKFNSVCILPSEIESCGLEKQDQSNQITINDFILLKTISSGAYGKVILARKKNTKDIFAVKVLEKEKMIQKNVIEFVINERNILNSMNNDFIVRGVYNFQSHKYLYMVMEFMKGGDFANLLEEFGCFEEVHAKYYLAQVVLALEYLHQNGIIHRDMKPDNILLDSDGHIKLTDFGLSEAGLKKIKETVQRKKSCRDIELLEEEKKCDMDKDIQEMLGVDKSQIQVQNIDEDLQTKQKRKSLKLQEEEIKKCKNRILGTADYMAPEVINGEEHTQALDFWSLGIICFEFLTGALPFNDATPEKVFKNILARDFKIWPSIGTGDGEISSEASDFIQKLLELDPQKRLGVKGIKEIKMHPFFKDIDWDKIKDQTPPFTPEGRDFDPSYFPKAKDHDEEIQEIIKDKKQVQREHIEDFNKFYGVNYPTLQSINAKEAKKALLKQTLQQKKEQGTDQKKRAYDSFKQEPILYDIKKQEDGKEQEMQNDFSPIKKVKSKNFNF